MAFYDILRDINDENRIDVLKSLTKENLKNAGNEVWSMLFEEMAVLKNRPNTYQTFRELALELYPQYELPLNVQKKAVQETHKVFDSLKNNDTFLHNMYRYTFSDSTKERSEIAQQTAMDMAFAMSHNFGLFRVEPFNDPQKDALGYAHEDYPNNFFLNTADAFFKKNSFNDLTRTAFHEMIHLTQFPKNKSDTLWGNAYAAYLGFTPRKVLTDKGYSEPYQRTLAAYKGNPMEAEAFITGDLIGELTKGLMKEHGLSQEKSNTPHNLKLLKNTYSQEKAMAEYGEIGTPYVGGIKEDHNPYNHLVVATRCLEAGLKEKIPDGRKNNFGKAFWHALAAAKHSEFLTDSPAGKALKIAATVASHPYIKEFGNPIGWNGMEKELNQALAHFEKSPNQAVSSAAQIAHGLFLNSKITVSGKLTKTEASVNLGVIPPRVNETGPVLTPDRTLNGNSLSTNGQHTQQPYTPPRNSGR